MGRYKWGYESPNMGYNQSYPTKTPLIATHEPRSGEHMDPQLCHSVQPGGRGGSALVRLQVPQLGLFWFRV